MLLTLMMLTTIVDQDDGGNDCSDADGDCQGDDPGECGDDSMTVMLMVMMMMVVISS